MVQNMKPNEIKILDVKVNTDLTQKDVLQLIEESYLKDDTSHYICTTNPEFIIDAQLDEEFRQIINNADLSVADGYGVVLSIEFMRRVKKYNRNTLIYPLQVFVTGVLVGIEGLFATNKGQKVIDGVGLVRRICELSDKKNYSIFLLGGRPKDSFGRKIDTTNDMATEAANRIMSKLPNVNIIGSTSQFHRDASDDAATVAYIKQCMSLHGINNLDFLFVAYNHNYQEKWILRNAHKINARVSVGIGGTLDYLSAYKHESPVIIRNLGLGWLYRLFTEPWRYKRIFKAFPLFPIKVFISALK